MLNGLLENKICASCKICCGFDNTDLWEMPVMNEKNQAKACRTQTERRIH